MISFGSCSGDESRGRSSGVVRRSGGRGGRPVGRVQSIEIAPNTSTNSTSLRCSSKCAREGGRETARGDSLDVRGPRAVGALGRERRRGV